MDRNVRTVEGRDGKGFMWDKECIVLRSKSELVRGNTCCGMDVTSYSMVGRDGARVRRDYQGTPVSAFAYLRVPQHNSK